MNVANKANKPSPTVIQSQVYNNHLPGNVFAQFENNLTTPPIVYNPAIKKGKRNAIALAAIIGVSLASILLIPTSGRLRVNLNNSISTTDEIINKTGEIFYNETELLTRAKLIAYRFVNKIYRGSINILGNIDHTKSYLSGKLTNKFVGIRQLVNFLNNKLKFFYSNTIKNVTAKKYGAVDKSFNDLRKSVKKSPNNIELSKILESNSNELSKQISVLTNKDNMVQRFKQIDQIITKTAYEYGIQMDKIAVSNDVTGSANKLFGNIISLNLAKSNLTAQTELLSKFKYGITFDKNEKVNLLTDLLKNIKYSNTFKPDSTLVKKWEDALKYYSNSLNADDEVLKTLLKEVNEHVNNPELSVIIEKTKNIIQNTPEGKIENILKDLNLAKNKGIITSEELIFYQGKLKQLRKKLIIATEFEKENLPGRLLDLNIGPTALLEAVSLATPVAILANETVSKAENKQERISNSIRYGPAIIGSVGGIVYSLKLGLYSYKALLFGLTTGYIFNKLGNFIDDNYYSKGRTFNSVELLSNPKLKNPDIKVYEV